MQKKSIGRRMWELFSPIVVVFVTTTVVELIAFFIYYAIHIPTVVDTIQTMDDFMEIYSEMLLEVLQHSVELTALSAVFAIPILARMKRGDEKKDPAKVEKKVLFREYLYIPAIAIPVSLALNNLLLLSNLAAYSESYGETSELLYSPSVPIQVLCIGIIIPIMEEYVFRGLIFNRIRRYVPTGYALVMSALFFGVYHGNLVQVVYGTLCGLLLAWLYVKYGSLKAPILAHIAMNLVSIVLTDIDAFTWMFSNLLRMGLITVACAALGTAVYLKIQRIEGRQENVGDEI